jgi:hypothetical protein
MATEVKIDDKVLQEIIKNVANLEPRRYIIADGVEYGVFQEFTDKGHPSLRPAFEKHTTRIPDIVGAVIERAPNRGLATVNLNRAMKKLAFDIANEWAADVNVDTGAYKNSIHVEEE